MQAGTERRLFPAYLFCLLLLLPFAPVVGQDDARWSELKPLDLDQVGSGELLWKSDRGLVPLPMAAIEVELSVTGIITHGRLTQRFHNPTGAVIEVLYAFPLPDRAAVHHMEMRIGDRRIVSEIREKQAARRTYEAAKESGKKAALVDQRRPNLFTTSAANINPGEQIEIVLEFYDEADYLDGSFSLRFPLTFVPRFVPTGHVEADAEGDSGTDAFGPRLTARTVTGVPRATLNVTLDPGFDVESLDSESHRVEVARDGGRRYTVRPKPSSILADRDFLLSWSPAFGDAPAAAAFVEDRDDGRYALLMVVPPIPEDGIGLGLPTETLFIVDVSSSMAGPSIRQARQALQAALGRLRPEDRFNILWFNDELGVYRDGFRQAEESELDDARDWVSGLDANGGTMIYPALMRGLELMGESSSSHAQRIIFLTDGAVANEQEIFRGVRERLGETRLHAIGIGYAPNSYLMRKMAFFGRGICEFVSSTGQADNRIDAFFSRLDRPVMTDLELDWDGLDVETPAPYGLPDLYAGQPLVLSVRIDGEADAATMKLGGYTRAGRTGAAVSVAADTPRAAGVSLRWARARVGALIDSLHDGVDPGGVRDAVVELGLEHHLVTRYTSLVAVEETPTAYDSSHPMRLAAVLPRGGTDRLLRLLLGSLLGLAGVAFGLWSRRTAG